MNMLFGKRAGRDTIILKLERSMKSTSTAFCRVLVSPLRINRPEVEKTSLLVAALDGFGRRFRAEQIHYNGKEQRSTSF